MVTIGKLQEVMPGLVKLYLAPISNVHNIIGEKIYVRNADYVYKLLPAYDSIALEQDARQSDNGSFKNMQLTCFVPGASAQNDKLLDEIMHFRFLVIYQDSQADFYRLGNQNNGLKLTYKHSSGSRESNAKGYAITLAGSLLEINKPCSDKLIYFVDDSEIPLRTSLL